LRPSHPPSSLTIGSVVIDPPVVLAPMAGFTSMPFRLVCSRAGAGLVCTEMASARALCYNSTRTLELMATCPAERPVSIQLFGDSPDVIARAVPVAVQAGADLIDINMGCTVPKVVRSGSGSALLKDHSRACEIVAAAVEASGVPVTVKLRAGLRRRDGSYLELASRLVHLGVAALVLHGRTVTQGFAGQVDLQTIKHLVEAVPIPVVGNGDILKPGDAVRMVEESGCAGVMIGRGALIDPLLLGRCAAALRGDTVPERLGASSRLAIGLCLAQMLALEIGKQRAAHKIRRHLGWCTKGLPDSAALRRELFEADTLSRMAHVMTKWAATHQGLSDEAYA